MVGVVLEEIYLPKIHTNPTFILPCIYDVSDFWKLENYVLMGGGDGGDGYLPLMILCVLRAVSMLWSSLFFLKFKKFKNFILFCKFLDKKLRI